jgi:putative two-component system response regulator
VPIEARVVVVLEQTAVKRAKILIVDEDERELAAVEGHLQADGFANCRATSDRSQALGLCSQVPPDLVLIDVSVDNGAAFEVMRLLRPLLHGRGVPMLALLSDQSADARAQARSEGASDLVLRPIDRTELLMRVENLLEVRYSRLEARKRSLLLEREIDERTRELHEARLDALRRLALAVEYRDDEAGQHAQRIGHVSARIAEAFGLDHQQTELIRHAAPLHDVGKVAIPDSVLLKKAKLTPEESAKMEVHVGIGRAILSGSDSPLLQMAEQIAATHHEWWDGSGYPEGLRGEEIPVVGRIVAIADAFDALTSSRPYQSSRSGEEALAEIRALAGRQFDPTLVKAFERLQLFGTSWRSGVRD